MFLLLVELDAKPVFAGELERILRKLVDAARQEAGTLYYAVHRPQDHQHKFVLYELYKDRAAFDAHLQSELLQQALKQFDAMLETPPKLTFCDTISRTSIG